MSIDFKINFPSGRVLDITDLNLLVVNSQHTHSSFYTPASQNLRSGNLTTAQTLLLRQVDFNFCGSSWQGYMPASAISLQFPSASSSKSALISYTNLSGGITCVKNSTNWVGKNGRRLVQANGQSGSFDVKNVVDFRGSEPVRYYEDPNAGHDVEVFSEDGVKTKFTSRSAGALYLDTITVDFSAPSSNTYSHKAKIGDGEIHYVIDGLDVEEYLREDNVVYKMVPMIREGTSANTVDTSLKKLHPILGSSASLSVTATDVNVFSNLSSIGTVQVQAGSQSSATDNSSFPTSASITGVKIHVFEITNVNESYFTDIITK